MQNIRLPPARENFVKETLKRSQVIAKECDDKCLIITYNLAVAKIARQIQIQKSPKFDDYFLQFGQFNTILSSFSSKGKMLEASGAAYLLSKANIIAGGSINKYLRGKSYIKLLSSWESFASDCNAWFASRKIYRGHEYSIN